MGSIKAFSDDLIYSMSVWFSGGLFFCRNMVFPLLSWYNRCKHHFLGKTSCHPIYRTPIVVKSGCPPITKNKEQRMPNDKITAVGANIAEKAAMI